MDSDVLTINYVFQSVILATLKSSNNNALRAVYDQILDDLDDEKDITFAGGARADLGSVLVGGHRPGQRFSSPFATRHVDRGHIQTICARQFS